MAELVAVGGAELPDAVDGPARAEVYHHEMDGTSFTEYFPWELTNTDYYRRVLAQVGYSLRALVARSGDPSMPGGGIDKERCGLSPQ